MNREREYNCFNDCRMQGCPGHKMEVSVQTTADIMTVKIDGETMFSFDPSQWNVFKEMVKSFDYNFFDFE